MATTADQDYDLVLKAYKPDGDVLGFMPNPLSLQVAYPHSDTGDIPSLIFEYRKDDPMAKVFKGPELEIAVVIWIKTQHKWVEPINSRFIVLSWEDDVTDDGNVIRFICPGYAWLLSKQLIRKGKKDDALNAAEAEAQKTYDAAKRKFDSAVGTRNGTLSAVKADMKYKGDVFAHSYFPHKVGPKGKQKWPKHQSILYHARKQKFYWYKGSSRRWYLIGKKAANDRLPTMKKHWDASVVRKNEMDDAKLVLDKRKFAAREATKDGKRPMIGTTAGWAIKRHWDESKSYGGGRLGGAHRSFNGTYATGRNKAGKLHKKWPTKFDMDLTIGQSILDTLKQVAEMGMCEWHFRGRTLDMFLPGASNLDRSFKTALHLGLDLTEAPDRATREGYANWLLVKGEKNLSFAIDQGGDGKTAWGSWEKSVSVSGVSKAASAKKLALKESKEALKKVKLESTRGLIVRPGGPRPMYDYLPGQSIGVYGTDGKVNKVRIMQVTLVRNADGLVTGNLVLGDRFMARAIDFTRSLARTLGGYEKVIGGGTVPMLPAPEFPRVPLEAPMTVAVTGRAGINPLTGGTAVIVQVSWSHDQENPIEDLPESMDPPDVTDPSEANPGDYLDPDDA